MLDTKSYTILDEDCQITRISTPLCVFKTSSFSINFNKFSQIIDKNQDVEFWIATDDCSKDLMNDANQLGIKNIISLPIDDSVIHEYFKKLEHKPQDVKFVNDVDLSNVKIAIVDDNDMNIKLLSEILSELNANIFSYTQPEMFLNNLENEQFDLFLLDILMPNISGLELAKEIKKSKFNSSVPIVFVSAMSDVETKLHSYEIGAYSYIEKPYNVEVVKSQIYNILKKQEQNKAINIQKENFVAMLTHDLKSPISAEINALELLIQKRFGEISDSQEEIIGSVLNSAKYMKHITDQILSFYRCNNGYINLHKEEVVLENIIIESISSIKFLFEEKNQKICIKNEIHDEKAFVDVIEIKRVIHNLVSNAVEYSPEGSKIRIKLSMNKSQFLITVKDSGYGIDSESLGNVFDEYMSLAKKQKRVGFGLGLNICKKIVSAHGGTIKINSKVGEGTEIQFTLPR